MTSNNINLAIYCEIIAIGMLVYLFYRIRFSITCLHNLVKLFKYYYLFYYERDVVDVGMCYLLMRVIRREMKH